MTSDETTRRTGDATGRELNELGGSIHNNHFVRGLQASRIATLAVAPSTALMLAPFVFGETERAAG